MNNICHNYQKVGTVIFQKIFISQLPLESHLLNAEVPL